jgi:hypothetical protein
MLAIDIIPEFKMNIRAIRKNIKIIKIVMNSRKKEIIPPNTIKEIPIRIKKKLNNNRNFLFLSEYPNAICYIINSTRFLLTNESSLTQHWISSIIKINSNRLSNRYLMRFQFLWPGGHSIRMEFQYEKVERSSIFENLIKLQCPIYILFLCSPISSELYSIANILAL